MTANGVPKMTAKVQGESSLLSLAENILEKTKGISEYLKKHGLDEPTFEAGTIEIPGTLEYQTLHTSLKNSLEDLERLTDGPRKHLRSFCCHGYDMAAVQIALEFNFFTLVPDSGEISLQQLAQRAGLDLDRTSRVIRMLVTYRFFQETSPGMISHSASSYVLLQDEELRCTVQYTLDEMLKAASASAESLRASPYESDSVHSPFNTRHGLPIFEFYAQNPKLAGRFARAMAGAAKMDRHIDELRDCFPWEDLQGKVVDIGGGSGHISISLARLFPQLKFVVQDGSNDMLVEGKKLLENDVRDRVRFAKHSFFDAQPEKDAAAFLIRQCTHNWCDRDVVTVFRAIVPGLEASKPGTPFLINDIIMPEPGVWPRHLERDIRQIDIIMLVGFGAKQRTQAEFDALLKQADERFEIEKLHADGPLGLLEVYLRQ